MLATMELCFGARTKVVLMVLLATIKCHETQAWASPTDLHGSTNVVVATDKTWETNRLEITNSNVAPNGVFSRTKAVAATIIGGEKTNRALAKEESVHGNKFSDNIVAATDGGAVNRTGYHGNSFYETQIASTRTFEVAEKGTNQWNENYKKGKFENTQAVDDTNVKTMGKSPQIIKYLSSYLRFIETQIVANSVVAETNDESERTKYRDDEIKPMKTNVADDDIVSAINKTTTIRTDNDTNVLETKSRERFIETAAETMQYIEHNDQGRLIETRVVAFSVVASNIRENAEKTDGNHGNNQFVETQIEQNKMTGNKRTVVPTTIPKSHPTSTSRSTTSVAATSSSNLVHLGLNGTRGICTLKRTLEGHFLLKALKKMPPGHMMVIILGMVIGTCLVFLIVFFLRFRQTMTHTTKFSVPYDYEAKKTQHRFLQCPVHV